MIRCIYILMIMLSNPLFAFNWHDLWVNPDQKATQFMEQGDYNHAQLTFKHPGWKAAAAFRNKQYQRAAELYESLNNEEGFYNQGNALAALGDYPNAIKAYDKALALNPKHQDASYNKKIVEQWLKKQSKENKQNKNDPSKQSNVNDSQTKENSDKSTNSKANQPDNQSPSENKQTPSKEPNKEDEAKPDKKSSEKNKMDKPVKSTQPASAEQQNIKERWLKLIPDEPGGLIREKFLRDYLRKHEGWQP